MGEPGLSPGWLTSGLPACLPTAPACPGTPANSLALGSALGVWGERNRTPAHVEQTGWLHGHGLLQGLRGDGPQVEALGHPADRLALCDPAPLRETSTRIPCWGARLPHCHPPKSLLETLGSLCAPTPADVGIKTGYRRKSPRSEPSLCSLLWATSVKSPNSCASTPRSVQWGGGPRPT